MGRALFFFDSAASERELIWWKLLKQNRKLSVFAGLMWPEEGQVLGKIKLKFLMSLNSKWNILFRRDLDVKRKTRWLNLVAIVSFYIASLIARKSSFGDVWTKTAQNSVPISIWVKVDLRKDSTITTISSLLFNYIKLYRGKWKVFTD